MIATRLEEKVNAGFALFPIIEAGLAPIAANG